ncbi:hypothetical protein SLE2022_268270 [Rubroshorea leprosula]
MGKSGKEGGFWKSLNPWKCRCFCPNMERNPETGEEKLSKNHSNAPVRNESGHYVGPSPSPQADSYSGMNAEERDENLKAAITYCNRCSSLEC